MTDAKLIKELRERTGSGFLDCKKALEASNNDIEAALEWLQERGQAKAAKKAGNISAEGVSMTFSNKNAVVMMELNSQTDFVTTNSEFLSYAYKIGQALLSGKFSSSEEANNVKDSSGKTIKEITIEATAKIGEKIILRRAVKFNIEEGKSFGHYTHSNKRVAAILVLEGGTDELARNFAMHVASMNPQYLNSDAIPTVDIDKMKKEISESEVIMSKPEKIREKIAEGMLSKKLSELTLVDQEFVMEKGKVSQHIKNAGAKEISMSRFEVAEGIEVEVVDFAAEVAAQMGK
ncbi:MAG: translation elongation factor Ts [Mollicutes bacterium PWAP]|nr:translation elongation factor Ts [Mollicutes bacterium PWAP]